MTKPALLILKDGTKFYGRSIGAIGLAVGEVVFNTSMTGYQEILTDPSYYRQIITFTCPHIGNVGTNINDEESSKIYAQGLIIRDLSSTTSNFRSEESLLSYLKRNHIVGIADIDTRKLTRLLREKGVQCGCIITGDNNQLNTMLALKRIQAFPGLKGMDLVKEVTTRKTYLWEQGSCTLKNNVNDMLKCNRSKKLLFNVVVCDYGVKRNILRMLVDRNCRLTIVPAYTSAKHVLNFNPDGIFLSNGPGDPEACKYAITAIQEFLKTDIPIFGICLGHQLLALASGAKTIKMKLGHHGSNHPVKNLDNNTVMITSQNHGFTVDKNNLPTNLRIMHLSLFDQTIQGLHRTDKPAFSFQGHPEANPGPHDAVVLFDYFIQLIKAYCVNKQK
ncbi:glutamine-hydrolyzing carbamoyl-phosphate synthase small subunit [Pantoea sp. Aalb]|uniref:glutamine-hydrolyzing carbamoyl-phosphate synthase small subunit n=1 Tax=Pantoea sp. Aalb TaxID=2576762 RepID=UPI00132696CA|nr:glutamine-hydrolyzing carbamoyl-phosphate synthase small subunit [Pantoea sp. Aalb]MXP67164.1 glutamine-hydrolyzing carbamoyl-phosphate synthase small subunit [Pantoea sp. Aalb]